MPSLVKKINEKQNRTRRDLISQAKVTCKEYRSVSGTFRRVRGHINTGHKLKCDIICTQRANCNFRCPGDLNCFILHSIRAYGQFFSGKNIDFDKD